MKKRTVLVAGAVGVAGGLGYLLTRKKGEKAAEPASTNGQDKAGSMRREGQVTEDQQLDNQELSIAQTTAQNNGHTHEVLDDRGTDQTEAAQILRQVRDGAFEGSDEKLALALGRPQEEIEQWTHGAGEIDGDVVLKARTLANHRVLEINA